MAAGFPGMGRSLVGLEGGEATFEAFSRASGTDVAALACTADAHDLFRDRSWELAVVATETAAANAWLASGQAIAASLGFSIGAYAALLAAGALEVEQVVGMIDVVLDASLKLPGRFSMLAMVGVPLKKVLPLCRRGDAELAAMMPPSQLLIAGREGPVRALAREVGMLALKVTTLSVRWPLHTSLMRPVAQELERNLPRLGRLRPLCLPVYSALHGGRIQTPEEGCRLLVEQLYRPQRFDLALEAALADGLRRCTEFGPAGTLDRAVRRIGHERIEVGAFPPVAPPRRRSAGWR